MNSRHLFDTVKCLSLPAHEQLAVLSELGCPGVIDELALQFHDQAVIADQLLEQGEIEPKQLSIVKEIDTKLTNMSGQHNATVWTEDALKHSPFWLEIRQLATGFFD